MTEFKNLKYLFHNVFNYQFQIDKIEYLGFFKDAINTKGLDYKSLKLEINQALLNPSFKWVEFAYENSFVDRYFFASNDDVVNLMKYYLYDYLYPDTQLSNYILYTFYEYMYRILLAKKGTYILFKILYEMCMEKHPELNQVEFYQIMDFLGEYKGKIKQKQEYEKALNYHLIMAI
jgi:hypothetical protein